MRTLLFFLLLVSAGAGCRSGCETDHDCKGDRVCTSGECTEPANRQKSNPEAEPAPDEALLDESLAFHQTVLGIIEDGSTNPDGALARLVAFEEETRHQRRALRKRLGAHVDGLSTAEKAEFVASARQKTEIMRNAFVVAVKRYPEDKQQRIRSLISVLTH